MRKTEGKEVYLVAHYGENALFLDRWCREQVMLINYMLNYMLNMLSYQERFTVNYLSFTEHCICKFGIDELVNHAYLYTYRF